MVRRCMLAAGRLLLLGGCGGDGDGATASRTPAATATPAAAKAEGPIGSKAPVLVEMTMQRPGALLDKITIHADGYGLFDRPSGGVGRVQRDVVVKKAGARAPAREPGEGPRRRRRAVTASPPRTSRPTSCATTAARWWPSRAPSRRSCAPRCGSCARCCSTARASRRSRASGSGASPAPRTCRASARRGRLRTLDLLPAPGRGRRDARRHHGPPRRQRPGSRSATAARAGASRTSVLRNGVLAEAARRRWRGLPRSRRVDLDSAARRRPAAPSTCSATAGRTLTAREGGDRARRRGPPMRILDGFIDGVGIDKTTRERATHTY